MQNGGACIFAGGTCGAICQVSSPLGSGRVDIRVLANGTWSGISTADQFTYSAGAPPTISSASPTSGPAGTTVRVSGSGMPYGQTTLYFGSQPAIATTCFNDPTYGVNDCDAYVPACVGVVPISAIVGTAVTSGAPFFFYVPQVTGLSVAAGPLAGQTAVTISGTGFDSTGTYGGTAVAFGPTAAQDVRCGSATQCLITSPSATSVGLVDARATVYGFKSTSSPPADGFTYVPTVTALNAAYTAAGQQITINGTRFSGANSVLHRRLGHPDHGHRACR